MVRALAESIILDVESRELIGGEVESLVGGTIILRLQRAVAELAWAFALIADLGCAHNLLGEGF